jgi:membrane protease YdiL (CAAX protease family)
MQTLEIALLLVLLLFPLVDLVLERYQFSTKSAEYIKTVFMLWAVTGFLLYCFFNGALSVEPPLYFPVAAWKVYLSIFMFITFFAYMSYVIFSINKNEQLRLHVIEALEKNGDSMDGILPTSRRELLLFTLLVSVSAGICEELIFRWYLYHTIEMQTDWMMAVFASSSLFGLWHLYLGWTHVLKTAFVGVLLCGIYLYFDSILVAMVAHILMDVYSGTIAFYARREREL